MALQDQLLSNSAVVSLLVIILAALALLASLVRPFWATRLEQGRGRVWRALDPIVRRPIRPLVRDKTGHHEYVLTVDCDLDELQQALFDYGFSYNPISTKKCRRNLNGDQEWTVGTWVYRDTLFAAKQHHPYIFSLPRGGLDVHMHREANLIRHPAKHVFDDQSAGDPDDVLREALDEAGIGYEVRPYAPPV